VSRPILTCSSFQSPFWVRPARDRSIQTPTFEDIRRSTTGVECNRSTRRRNTPCHGFHDKQPVHDPRAVRTIWARHLDQVHAERRELHPQQRSLLLPVLLRLAACSGAETPTRLQASTQGPSPCMASCSPGSRVAASSRLSRTFSLRDQVSPDPHRSLARKTISQAGVVQSLSDVRVRSDSNNHSMALVRVQLLAEHR